MNELHVPAHLIQQKLKIVNKTRATAPAKLTGRFTTGTSGGVAAVANLI